MKINVFRGDLTDISAVKTPLLSAAGKPVPCTRWRDRSLREAGRRNSRSCRKGDCFKQRCRRCGGRCWNAVGRCGGLGQHRSMLPRPRSLHQPMWRDRRCRGACTHCPRARSTCAWGGVCDSWYQNCVFVYLRTLLQRRVFNLDHKNT